MKTELMRSMIKELAGGRIFSVDFTKKGGEARTLTGRLEVKTPLRGGELPFCPVEKGLLPVFDIIKAGQLAREGKCVSGAYRMINLDTVTELRANGQVYKF